VKRFLDEKHPGKYHVFNVSESPYEKERFDGRVTDFNWHDHHAPPFTFIPELTHLMTLWLTGKYKSSVFALGNLFFLLIEYPTVRFCNLKNKYPQ
jgi:hypothetical protein